VHKDPLVQQARLENKVCQEQLVILVRLELLERRERKARQGRKVL